MDSIMNSYDLILNKDTILSSSSSCSSISSCSSSSFYLNSTSRFENLKNAKTNSIQKQKKQKQSFSKIFSAKIFKKKESKKIFVASVKKSKTNLISTAIFKLMDKSVGWFGKKTQSQSTKKTQLKIRKFSSQCNSTLSVESFCLENDISDLNDKFYFQKSTYLVSAPSMCSSFDATKQRTAKKAADEQLHSTPRSLFQQFSPIKYSNSSLEISIQPSTSSSSVLSISPSLKRRRLSFGVTSSPVSLNENVFDETDSSNVIDFRLLEHLNEIKRNIKLGVESRQMNLKRKDVDSNSNEDLSVIKSKRRKLQQIFQLKLKKQINEIKRWQVGVKNEIDMDEFDEFHYENRLNFRRNSTYSTKKRADYETQLPARASCNCCSRFCRAQPPAPMSNCNCITCLNMQNTRYQMHHVHHQDYFYNNYYNHYNNYNYNHVFNSRAYFQNIFPQNVYHQKNCCQMCRNHF